MEYYSNANLYSIRGVFLRGCHILTSFGCPSSCTFCVAKNMRKHFGVERFKSPKDILDEVRYLKTNYNIDSFYIIDDLFTVNKKRTVEFCQLIEKEQLLWGCSSKISGLDRDTIMSMSKSGCIQIDFGVERGSDEALKVIKKDITIKQIEKVFGWCKEAKIRTFANFLVGLPQESCEDLKDIDNLIKKIQPTVVTINKFVPYLGTDLYDQGYKDVSDDKNLDLWIKEKMKEHNSLLKNIKFIFDKRYIKILWRSKRKLNYLKQAVVVVKEVANTLC